MRKWIRLAARLYPRPWRQRYGSEFDALLEEAAADWRQLFNVAWGAFAIRLKQRRTGRELAGSLAIAGSLVALAASYAMPARYVSSAMLRLSPQVVPGQALPKEMQERQTEDRIEQLNAWMHLLPADFEIARHPALDLYRAERERGGVEQVAKRVQQDLEIRRAEQPGRDGVPLRVSFAYSDPYKARAVVNEVVAQMQAYNGRLDRNLAERWEYAWTHLGVPHGPFPYRATLELAEPASLPETLPRRLEFLGAGSVAGLLLGLLAIGSRRHPRMALRVAVCALAGCLAGVTLSPQIFRQHTATAVIHIAAPFDPLHLSGVLPTTPVGEWAQRLKQEVLASDEFWSRMRGSDGSRPRDLQFGVRMLEGYSTAGSASTFEVSVSGADAKESTHRLMLFAAYLMDQHHRDLGLRDEDISKQLREMTGRDGAEFRRFFAVERGQRASMVEQPRLAPRPYRWCAAIGGALAGILLCLIAGRNRTGGYLAAIDLQGGTSDENSNPDFLRLQCGLRPDCGASTLV